MTADQPTSSARSTSPPSKDRLRIVIAADELEMRHKLQKKLGHIGYSNTKATDRGKEVLSHAQRGTVDLFITSRYLTDVACQSLIRKLRGLPNGEALPILMVTHPITHEGLLSVVDWGVDDVLLYPCEVEALTKKVEDLITPGL